MKLLEIALVQLGLSLFIGVMVLFVTYKLVRGVIMRRYDVGEGNIAFSIFVGAFLFAVGYIVSSTIQPLLSTFRLLEPGSSSILPLMLKFSGYVVFFVFISWLIAVASNAIGMYLFTMFTTHVKELEEISKNNIAVAVITGVTIIVLALFIRDAVGLLLEAIVPYPELPREISGGAL